MQLCSLTQNQTLLNCIISTCRLLADVLQLPLLSAKLQILLLLPEAASGSYLYLSALHTTLLLAKGIFYPLLITRTFLLYCVMNLSVRHHYTEPNQGTIRIVKSRKMVHHQAARITYLQDVLHFPNRSLTFYEARLKHKIVFAYLKHMFSYQQRCDKQVCS